MEEIIVGVVGVLQFDVLKYRLENEYNVEIRMEGLPYEYIRWVESSETPVENISGTSDLAPIDEQEKILKELFPDVKQVGLLYCSAEANSLYQIELFEKACDADGVAYKRYAIADTNEIQAVVSTAASEYSQCMIKKQMNYNLTGRYAAHALPEHSNYVITYIRDSQVGNYLDRSVIRVTVRDDGMIQKVSFSR